MAVSQAELVQVLARIGRLVDARTLAAELRLTTGRDIRKRDINPMLYGSALFVRHDGTPPLWRVETSVRRPLDVRGADRAAGGSVASPEVVPEHRPHLPSPAPIDSAPKTDQPKPTVPEPRVLPTTPAAPSVPSKESSESTHWPLVDSKPYEWQKRAYDWWLQNGRCGIVEAVTGTGKTLVGLAALAQALQRGERALLLVPSIVLQTQWRDRLTTWLPSARVGLLGDGNDDSMDRTHQILVATVHSASTRAAWLANRYQLVVADECHRYGAESFQFALLENATARMGLTATFERADDGVDAVLRPYFGSSFSYSYDEATSEGVLASFVVADVGIELSSVERERFDVADRLCRRARAKLIRDYGYPSEPGSFMQRVNEAAKAMFGLFGEGKLAKQYVKGFRDRQEALSESSARIAVLDNLASSIVESGRVLLFTESIDAATNACARLGVSGVRARAYHSKISTTERARTLKDFADGRLQALVAVRALDEGVDVPDVDLGIILSASRTKRQMIQRLGRVVRRKPDGRYARLVIVYAEGTYEDPLQGSHEAFREAVNDAADDMRTFRPGETGQVAAYLASFSGSRRNDDDAVALIPAPTGMSGSSATRTPLPLASSAQPDDPTTANSSSESDLARSSLVPGAVLANDSVAHVSASMPGRDADELADDVGPQIAFDGANGRLVIGRKSFDLHQERSARQTGTMIDYHFRGEHVALLDVANGGKRLTIRLGPAHRTLELVNPSLEVQQAAIALAIAAWDELEARSSARLRLP